MRDVVGAEKGTRAVGLGLLPGKGYRPAHDLYSGPRWAQGSLTGPRHHAPLGRPRSNPCSAILQTHLKALLAQTWFRQTQRLQPRLTPRALGEEFRGSTPRKCEVRTRKAPGQRSASSGCGTGTDLVQEHAPHPLPADQRGKRAALRSSFL